MRTHRSCLAAWGLAAVALGAAGCTSGSAQATGPSDDPPAVVETASPGAAARITLSERAEERLGIRTAPVAAGPTSLVVPYAAVVYDADGTAWAFARLAPRSYERAPITVSGIAGDQATLSAGPAVGTEVVTVGASELVGVEAGISGEE